MKDFLVLLNQEQASISAALLRVVASLPSSVREIAYYSLLSGGKRLRPILTLLCARLINPQITLENPKIYDAAIVLEMFHVASLLHDDVLDNADTRRGQTSAYIKFGIKPCLLAGDALLAAGNRLMAQFQCPELMETISNALLYTATGQIEEIENTGKIFDNIETYLSVIEGKTAWILRSACEVGVMFAYLHAQKTSVAQNGVPIDKAFAVERLGVYGLNLGMAFQIVDDALDFAPEKITGKPQGGDLRERKCTPPILMFAQSLDEKTRARFERKFAHESLSEKKQGGQNEGETTPTIEFASVYTQAHALFNEEAAALAEERKSGGNVSFLETKKRTENKDDKNIEDFIMSDALNFTQQEAKLIIQKIIENKFPEKTKDLALSYLEIARKSLDSFSGDYKDMLLKALLFVQEREK